MKTLIHINNTSSNKMLKKINPNMVYIPLRDKNNYVYEPIIDEGKYVFKDDIIAIDKKNNFPIHSPVSGYYVYRNNKITSDGNISSCMVIENDYKEKYHKEKIKRKKYNKEDFIRALQDNGIVGLSGNYYPTYLKYKTDNIKYLLINAVECEPYVCCDKNIIYNYSEEILECIDNILEIMNIPNAIIAIKDSDITSYEMLTKYIGTYPNIKIYKTKDIYPNGWERLLIENIFNITSNENNIIVNNVSTVYSIYEMLKYNRPLIERVITIVIPCIKLQTNIKVKIGTLASDILKELDYYNKLNDPLFIVGGLFNGNSLPTDDVVITKDVNSIFVIENNFERSKPCIKCGKCIEVCPVNINPVTIMNNHNNIDKLNKLKPNKCIECGLCSYICPSKIEIREIVKTSKERVNSDEI